MYRFHMWAIQHKPTGTFIDLKGGYDKLPIQLFYVRKFARLFKKNVTDEKYPFRSTKVVKVFVQLTQIGEDK